MKTSRFAEDQIALAIMQSDLGTKVQEIYRKKSWDAGSSAMVRTTFTTANGRAVIDTGDETPR